MKKHLHIIFLLIIQTLTAQAQAPQFISPANGATVPSTFNVQVAAYPGAGGMWLEYRRVGSGTATLLQQSGTGPYTFTLTGLEGNTQYELKAIAVNSDNPPGGLGVSSIFVTTTAPLVVTFPANNQTELPLAFNVQAEAYAGASSVIVQWRPVGGTYNTTNQSIQLGSGPYSLPVSGLAINTSYDIQVRALDASGSILAETTLRITTTTAPQFISPANGATVPSTFNVQVAAYPGAGGMWLEYRRVGSGTATLLQQSGTGPYTFTLTGLEGNTQYELKAIAVNSDNPPGGLGVSSIFVTTTAPLVVTFPANNQTELPLAFNVQAEAYAGASSVIVQWRPVGGTYNTTNQSIQLGSGPYSLPVSGLAINTSYDIQVRALDASGAILAETTLRITTTTAPQFISPANGATDLPSTFNVQVAAYPGATAMRLEWQAIGVAFDPANSQQLSGTGPYTFRPSGLVGGFTYVIRAIALNSTGGGLGTSSITVTIADVPYLIVINGENIEESTVLAINQFENTFSSQVIINTINYRWEFSKTSDFASFEVFNSGSNPNLTLRATDLESGERYYVRIASVKFNNAENVNKPVRSFYNALHPISLYAPNSLTRGTTRLWTAPVKNDEFALFQIDDDPNFGSPHINPNNLGYSGNNGGGNSTYPFISGNVFRSNSDWYWNDATQSGCFNPACGTLSSRTYTYVAGLLPGTYYVRVRAVNLSRGQTGYWSNVSTINISIPAIQPPVFVMNTYTNVTPGYVPFRILEDPHYIVTGYDFQVSKDDFATTALNIENVLGVHFEVRGLEYNTTYKARARSYIKNNLNQNVLATDWYTITFTTQASPTARTSFEEVAGAQGSESNKALLTHVFPNPFTASTRIVIHPDLGNTQIRVSNAMGRVVELVESFGGETIELGDKWSKGMYIIQVIGEDRSVTTYKIIKQ
jgi:hypothetical protein